MAVTPSPPGRLHALDGMRGVAALIVLVHHTLLIARPYARDGTTAGAIWDVVEQSPAKLLFAGGEAVLVFFVLSGLVVPLPFLRGAVRWPSFFAARFVRLYVPVWAALAVSAALIVLIPRRSSRVAEGSWVERTSATDLDPGDLLQQATLLVPRYDLINTLWSLRWEVLFSVLLPVMVLIAIKARRNRVLWWGTFVLTAAASVLGRTEGEAWLQYLPLFLLGTLLAVRLEEIRAWAQEHRRSPVWGLLGTVSALALVASWWIRPMTGADQHIVTAMEGIAGIAASGLVVWALGSPMAQRVLAGRLAQRLGTISFSLYLLHVPVLVTLSYLLGDRLWLLVALCGIPLSLIASRLFFVLIERPSHRLAKRIGAGVAAGLPDRTAVPEAEPEVRRAVVARNRSLQRSAWAMASHRIV